MPPSTEPTVRAYLALAAFRYELRIFLRFGREYLSAGTRLTTEQSEALLAVKSFPAKASLSVGMMKALALLRD